MNSKKKSYKAIVILQQKEYENQIWNGIKFNKFPNSQAGRETLRKGLYGILVVVIKFQIGFILHAKYVDKSLSGIKAV